MKTAVSQAPKIVDEGGIDLCSWLQIPLESIVTHRATCNPGTMTIHGMPSPSKGRVQLIYAARDRLGITAVGVCKCGLVWQAPGTTKLCFPLPC